MIKVVSYKICPFVQRVTAALAARNIAFEIEYISLKEKPQWFLDASPNAQVPILITENNTVLFESDAIVEYIEDVYGPLQMELSHEQHALHRAWSYLGTKHYLTQCGAMSSKDKHTLETRSQKLYSALAKIEQELSGRHRYFNSETLGNVDIAWLPILHRSAIIKQFSEFDFLQGLPKTQAWQRAVLENTMIQASVSDDFESLFRQFYLNNTFLGQGESVEKSTCSTSCCV